MRQTGQSRVGTPMRWPDVPGMAAWLDFLCPPRCVFCQAEQAFGQPPICRPCATAMSAGAARCTACGRPAHGSARCRGRVAAEGVVVLSDYADEVRAAVLKAKRPGGEAVAAGLGSLLVAKHRERLEGWRIDAVVPVPMHWLRRITRGASAADTIAAAVARGLGLPSRRMLGRWRATRRQNACAVGERPANVRGAFRARGRPAGRRLLLVDDVSTTGATLAECRRVLVEAGAAAVYAAVIARADRRPEDDSDDL